MKKILFLLISFWVFNSYPQNPNSQVKLDSLQKKVSAIEIKFDTREKELIDLQKTMNIVHNNSIEAKDKAFKTERELWSEKFGWLSRALALVSVVFGLFIGWFGLRKLLESKANELFEKYLIDRFKEIKESDIAALYSEIESAAWKAQIRNKKVLIINQTDTILPADFITALKVFNPAIKTVDEPKVATKIDFSKYSLVVLENYEDVGFWDMTKYKDDLIALADKICKNGTAFIYYGDSRNRFPETNVNKHLVNYANSPSQLYNNAMNTLKFQDLLSKV